MRRRFAILSLLVLIAGCAGGPVISPSDQSLLAEGDQLHSRLNSALIDTSAPRVHRYLEQVTLRITATARDLNEKGLLTNPSSASNAWMFNNDIRFHLVDHPRLNSFTPGGRHLYVYDGLMSQCRNEDELAASLCHAYAHLYARLSQQALRRDPSLSGDAALLAPYANMRLSSSGEAVAGHIAFTLFSRAGWDPTRFATLEQRLLDARPPNTTLDANALRQRVEEAARAIEALPDVARDWPRPPIADDARFIQLQAEVKAISGTRNPTRPAQLLLAAFPSCFNLADTPAQAAARAELFPPPPANTGNQWGKGFPGR